MMKEAAPLTFGPALVPDGVRFSLWAPSAQDVRIAIEGQGEHAMTEAGNGWREAHVPGLRAGARYRFVVDGLAVPDPASGFQPEDVFGPSEVVDPTAYAWQDSGWTGRPWEEVTLYEVHVGTATSDGTYAALAERLPALAELGITAISLMPLADFAGRRNWGYDGVLPYAPDSVYGTPDDLRRLVDRAHGLGLAVVLDVVYNHFGPAGNYLPVFAKSFFTDRHKTPWGDGPNFDGSGGIVRNFFIGNAIAWLRDYHIDGLRFDAVHAIEDDSPTHFIGELATRVRAELPGRHIHLILENEHNEAKWLERDEGARPKLHTAQWDDDIHHCWHVLLTGEHESYYGDFADRPVERLARCLAEGFAYQGERSANLKRERGYPSGHLPPSAFVSFLQNHDQVGNRAIGDRIASAPEHLALARAGLLLAPQIPMLFMGEEWAASTPFQFFVDFSHDEGLSKAVREGRRREFAGFASFAGSEEDVPDPTSDETFRASKLDWSERERSPHAEVLADTARLLALRRTEIVPLTRSAWRGSELRRAGPDWLDVVWRYEAGTLRMVLNFGPEPLRLAAESGARTIWRSPGARDDNGAVALTEWTGMVTLTTGADSTR